MTSVVTDVRLPGVIVVRGLLAGAFFGGEAFVPLKLVEAKDTSLVWAGAALTVGSLGWMAGSWVQSRTWLRLRRDTRMALAGSVAFGLTWVTVNAVRPTAPAWSVATGWVLAGFGMGLTTASTALAVIWLSRVSEHGRNASSLNLSDALGSALFVIVSGSLFAALHPVKEAPESAAAVVDAVRRYGRSRPRSRPRVTTSSRVEHCSFRRIATRWAFTVLREMCSSSPIWPRERWVGSS